MNKILSATILSSMIMLSSSCDSQLDIVPKGQTTLDRTADIELLLNQEYDLGDFPYTDLAQICGEGVGMGTSIPEMMSNTNTLAYAYLAYDENVDRITLAQEDARYNAIYKYINYCNTLLAKIDAASGMEEKKPQLKAEARVMRAYLHWLALVIHAAQYDTPEQAANAGGIAYVTDIDNTAVKRKLTLVECYELILEDCASELIDLLPEKTGDVCRPGKPFGYALRGRVLMQMKRYEEALPWFEKSIALNSTVDDRVYIKDTESWVLERDGEYNLLQMGAGPLVNPTMEIITRETALKFEKNDYVLKYCGNTGWDLSFGKMYSGLDGFRMCMSWGAQGNPYGMTSVRTLLSAAECLIRTGDIRRGLEFTDMVRKAHVENASPYVRIHDMMPLGELAAMRMLQQTKWIECLGSYENFFDMKRWNTEKDYATTVSKDLDMYGTKTLSPDSPLWILPFPAKATRYNPTLTQNF
ncbi:MAG: RagB/SusD family nutrient uptake outer membrane protein [Muribaculaceae bacterium]|nr:RagB/SusD family nutrient uptake outer membrane protein [Muribaculaceae bacterium]